MAEHEVTIWGIHGGKTGDAETLFLKKNHIAIGWARLGDLNALKGDRDAFRAQVAARYADKKPTAILNYASQLYRFAHEMKTGDLIIYPSRKSHLVHIGRVDGPYKYDPSIQAGYPDLRQVKWLKSLPRTHFSLGALYEIGAAMSLFQVKNHADEFRAVLDDKAPDAVVDDTVGEVRENIEETTRDFILRQLAHALKGQALKEFVAHLLATMGYHRGSTYGAEDSGIDLIVYRDELGLDAPAKVQVKAGETNVGDPVVTALCGKIADGEYGMLVTLGKFTPGAFNLIKSKPNLRLIDGDEIVDLVLEHYEQLDVRYKSLFPLKRVYIPDALDSPEP